MVLALSAPDVPVGMSQIALDKHLPHRKECWMLIYGSVLVTPDIWDYCDRGEETRCQVVVEDGRPLFGSAPGLAVP